MDRLKGRLLPKIECPAEFRQIASFARIHGTIEKQRTDIPLLSHLRTSNPSTPPLPIPTNPLPRTRSPRPPTHPRRQHNLRQLQRRLRRARQLLQLLPPQHLLHLLQVQHFVFHQRLGQYIQLASLFREEGSGALAAFVDEAAGFGLDLAAGFGGGGGVGGVEVDVAHEVGHAVLGYHLVGDVCRVGDVLRGVSFSCL